MTWTRVECPFEKDKKIQNYLLTAPIYSEEGEAPAWRPPQRLAPLPHGGLITIPTHTGEVCEGGAVGRGQRKGGD